MGVGTTADFAEKPYSEWTETVIKNMFEVDPVCISMQMRDADGKSYTSYWNCSQDDRSIMMDAIREDWLFAFLDTNKEDIKAILEGDEEEGDEDDEPCETDTGSDSEG